jgi:hypothetical protein
MMKMTKETLTQPFSPSRVFLLAKNRALEDLPAFGIGAGILAGLNLLNIIIFGRAVMNEVNGQTWAVIISIAGFLLAAAAFKDMHDGRAGTEWILLPATSLEKYTAALIFYAILYPLVAATAAFALSVLLSLAELLAGGPGGRIWNPLAVGFEGWVNYATGALIFAAGSATFRKRAFIKTMGISIAYALVCLGLLLVGIYLIARARGLSPSLSGLFQHEMNFSSGNISLGAQRTMDVIIKIVRYALTPLFAIFYGYFRVAEKEARDEVQ